MITLVKICQAYLMLLIMILQAPDSDGSKPSNASFLTKLVVLSYLGVLF